MGGSCKGHLSVENETHFLSLNVFEQLMSYQGKNFSLFQRSSTMGRYIREKSQM